MKVNCLKYFFTEDAVFKNSDFKLFLSLILKKNLYNSFMHTITLLRQNNLYEKNTFKISSSKYLYTLFYDLKEEWLKLYINSRKKEIIAQWHNFVKLYNDYIVNVQEFRNGFIIFTNDKLTYTAWNTALLKFNLDNIATISVIKTFSQKTSSGPYIRHLFKISLLLE